MVIKRGRVWYAAINPFKEKAKVWISLPFATNKTESKRIATALLRACRLWDFSGLLPDEREALTRMFANKAWKLPDELATTPGGTTTGTAANAAPTQELTLWRAAELFIKSPDVRECKMRAPYEFAIGNLVRHIGKNSLLTEIRVPRLREYRIARIREGVSPSTVNKEVSCLSRIFVVMAEMELLSDTVNPCRLLRGLSEKDGLREVYVSRTDVARIAAECPHWYQPLIWTAYLTGMRRGEIVTLQRRDVDPKGRMIRLLATATKEGKAKRVPIHRELEPILAKAMRTPVLGTDVIFTVTDGRGTRPLGTDSAANPWKRALDRLQWPQPRPTFHDLRATWKVNSRRSGMDPEVRELILGHSTKGKTVIERYGHVGDDELIRAIDLLTFGHGETVILAKARTRNHTPDKPPAKKVATR